MNVTSTMKSGQQSGLITPSLQSNRPSNRRLSSVGMLAALTLSLIPGAKSAVAQTAPAATPVFPAAGVYLYGQAPEPEQMGMGYMVFETVDQRMVGAMYMPNSSFDCFEGQMQGNQLAMTITNSYTQESYPYAVALVTNDAIASISSETLAPLSLDGFYQLPEPSENDLRILATCKANLQQ